jgi:hypothetical protein
MNDATLNQHDRGVDEIEVSSVHPASSITIDTTTSSLPTSDEEQQRGPRVVTTAATGASAGEIASLKAELETYKREVDILKRENELLSQQHLPDANIEADSNKSTPALPVGADHTALLEAEFLRVREQVVRSYCL